MSTHDDREAPDTDDRPTELAGPPHDSPETIADEIFRKLGPPPLPRR